MNDITERLRRLYVQHGTNYVQEAANEIERLRAEVEVQSYWGPRWEKAQAELAASQAREDALREAFAVARDAVLNGRGALESVLDSEQTNAVLIELDYAFREAGLPASVSGSSALRERLRAERERCAKACDDLAYAWRGANSQIVECVKAIRAMGDAE